MAVAPLPAPRFIRKTQLGANEYRKNFHQIDREIIAALTSTEADQVTPLMSKIYLRLVNAPARYWERDGVVRIEAETREGKLVKAWAVLCDLVGVASATASKAIQWMHEQGIIGYFSGKNGVGLRIFLNRAASSIGERQAQGRKKILVFPPASSDGAHGSANEPAFKDSFAVPESLDTNINSGAPQNGADKTLVDKTASDSPPISPTQPSVRSMQTGRATSAASTLSTISINEIVHRLRNELEPSLQRAAYQAAEREHQRTREWLESRGLPKAARVAQHEAYNVLRKHGVLKNWAQASHAEVGRNLCVPPDPHLLSSDEIKELAQACVALLETQGQSIELSLSEMSAATGGILLPEDAPRVRAKVESLLGHRSYDASK
jgi:hypothetical protein